MSANEQASVEYTATEEINRELQEAVDAVDWVAEFEAERKRCNGHSEVPF